jgi:iron(III) transport system substrate-binding protein
VPRFLRTPIAAIAVLSLGLAACGSPVTTDPAAATPGATTASPDEPAGSITVYSGRSEELVGPLLRRFSDDTGIEVQVRYGDTAEMASLIVTEGENSPADVFFAQDAGALGAVAREGLLAELPDELLDRVDARFRSPADEWVGVSGRARVVAYNTDNLTEDDLPDSIFGFTDPEWAGRIGWAPTNGSFQAFVTALRAIEGEDRAREWLEGIEANDPKVYEGNNPALDAVIAGEVDVAFINHYYLMRRLEEDPGVSAANHFLSDGDPGALVNVAGAGVLTTSDNPAAAERFVEYLLSDEAQAYFAEETKEYPLVEGVEADPDMPPLAEIGTPEIDLSDLSDLEGTLELLQEVGIL